MRILQIHNYYQHPGGEDVVLANEQKLLSRMGHNVWQYTLHNDAVRQMSKVDLAMQTWWSGASYGAVRKKIQKHGIDLVHAHNTFPLISPAVYYAAHAEKVPVVQTLHNYRMLCPAATFFRDGVRCEACLGKTIPLPAIVNRCYRGSLAASGATALMLAGHRAAKTYSTKVAAYIAPSQFSLDKFVAGGMPRQLMRMKPNFVLDDPGIGSGHGGYALYAGRLAPEKGVHTMVNAWTALKRPIRLKIAGDGPLRGEVEELVRTNSNVEYLGQCPRARVDELMRGAALLVFPSEWYECSPLSMMEAMACGTPVLAPDQGSLSELIVAGQNGMLFPLKGRAENVAALAAAVEEAFLDRGYLDDMRYATRQYYEKNFAAGPNYKALMAIYQSVMPDAAGSLRHHA